MRKRGATPVTIAFHAQHPNNFTTFDFTTVRGASGVMAGSTFPDVVALAAGSYTGDGIGNFSHDFPCGVLLDTRVNAAFAEQLHRFAKATTGWGSRISSHDAGALRAFALAPEEP